MNLIIQFIDNTTIKFNVEKNSSKYIMNNNQIEYAEFLIPDDKGVLSYNINNHSVYNSFIITVVDKHNMIDKYIVNYETLKYSLSRNISKYFRCNIFDNKLIFNSKKFTYKLYLDDYRDSIKISNITIIRNKRQIFSQSRL